MEKKRYRLIYVRTFAAFLAVWLLMVVVLTHINLDRMEEIVADQYDGSSDLMPMNAEALMERQDPTDRIGILTWWQIQGASYQGSCLGATRVYDSLGNELARSPMSAGLITLNGMGTADVTLLFDPVLTDEEQLSLAKFLRGDTGEWSGGVFLGTDSGKIDVREGWPNIGLYGEVTGIRYKDALYPKTLTFYYEDKTLTPVNSTHAMFDGAELTTLRFDYAMVNSILSDRSSTPERLMKLYYRVNELTDDLLDGAKPKQNSSSTLWAGDGRASVGAPLTADVTVARSYAYIPWRMATHGLWFTYIATFLMIALAALLIARGQVRTLKRERQFTRAVAHELKTPAAVLRAYAEALGEGVEPAQQREYCATVVEEADRMAQLVSELLELSRMEGGAELGQWDALVLGELVREQFGRLSIPMQERELYLEMEFCPVSIMGNPKRLMQMCSNLAMNVLHHAKPGVVQVQLKQEGERAVLTVENPCDPIPTEQLSRLWEPFYKLDESRGGEGSGMGLAVVKNIVEFHGGTCRAELTDGGIRFRIELPV